MPELPEVEVAARNLRRWAVGRRVRGVEAAPSRVLRPGGPRALAAIAGARVQTVDRVGKHLLLTLVQRRAPKSRPAKAAPPPQPIAGGSEPSQGSELIGLWSHLGMTGKWLRRRAATPAPRFSRARIALDDGAVLHYADMRLFGRLRVVPGARFAEVPELAALGPDPLRDGVDAARLHQRLGRLRLPVKVALLDQRLVAGVGNIQAIEALWRARIDPRRSSRSLSRPEVARLARAILASIAYTLAQFHEEGVDRDSADIVYVEESRDENPFRVYARA